MIYYGRTITIIDATHVANIRAGCYNNGKKGNASRERKQPNFVMPTTMRQHERSGGGAT